MAARHVEKNGATLKRNGAKISATRTVPLMKRIIWKVIDGAYTEFPDPTQHLGEPSCGRKHKSVGEAIKCAERHNHSHEQFGNIDKGINLWSGEKHTETPPTSVPPILSNSVPLMGAGKPVGTISI